MCTSSWNYYCSVERTSEDVHVDLTSVCVRVLREKGITRTNPRIGGTAAEIFELHLKLLSVTGIA